MNAAEALSRAFGPLWQQIAVFGLVLVRVSLFVAACPPFAPEALRGRFRAALCLSLAVLLTLASPPVVLPADLVPAGVLEALLGAAMGLGVRMAAVAISFAGEMLEMVAGFSFMQMVNPMSQEQAGPMRTLFQVTGGLVFFVSGGQATVIEALAGSVVRVPPGEAPFLPQVGFRLASELAATLEVSLRIAAPMLAGAFATLLALAFLTKVAPQLNIWSIGFVITCGMMLAGLFWYTPSWLEQVASLWRSRARHAFEQVVF